MMGNEWFNINDNYLHLQAGQKRSPANNLTGDWYNYACVTTVAEALLVRVAAEYAPCAR